jgi:predicted DNA-binding transcriptional regulator YafY
MSQTERIFYVDREIREGRGATIADVAERFEVSERQVKRDIEYMRDRLGAPIEWDAKRRRYVYREPWESLAAADEKSLFAISFLKSILSEYAYVPVLSNELIGFLEGKISRRYERIADRVSYELPTIERIGNTIAYTLCQALVDQAALHIEYLDSKGEKSSRVILPAHLINYSGKWYCIARDSKSLELRTFSVARMEAAKEILNPSPDLVLPTKEEIEKHLSSSYGIFKGEPIGRASLRFTGGAARAIRHQEWHREQSIQESSAPDGSLVVDLSLPVHDWTEILGRALRCGANCEVLAPPEFRERWVSEIRRMSELVIKAQE